MSVCAIVFGLCDLCRCKRMMYCFRILSLAKFRSYFAVMCGNVVFDVFVFSPYPWRLCCSLIVMFGFTRVRVRAIILFHVMYVVFEQRSCIDFVVNADFPVTEIFVIELYSMLNVLLLVIAVGLFIVIYIFAVVFVCAIICWFFVVVVDDGCIVVRVVVGSIFCG